MITLLIGYADGLLVIDLRERIARIVHAYAIHDADDLLLSTHIVLDPQLFLFYIPAIAVYLDAACTAPGADPDRNVHGIGRRVQGRIDTGGIDIILLQTGAYDLTRGFQIVLLLNAEI